LLYRCLLLRFTFRIKGNGKSNNIKLLSYSHLSNKAKKQVYGGLSTILVLTHEQMLKLQFTSDQGDRQNFFQGRANQDQEISSKSLPSFYQWQLRGRTEHASKGHLKETLYQHQDLRIKNFRKNAYNFRKFSYNLSTILGHFSTKKTLFLGPP